MRKVFDRFDAFCKKHWFACDMIVAEIDLVIILMPFLVRDVSDPERYTFIIFMYGFMASSILTYGILESIKKLKKMLTRNKCYDNLTLC